MSALKMRFLYTGIRVRNLQRSLRFYRAIGFRVTHRGRMEHGGVFVHLKTPQTPQRLEFNYYPKGTRFYEPFRKGTELDHLGFWVGDVDECLTRLKKIGAKVLIKPWSEGNERLAFVNDPDGITIELLGRTKKRSKRSQ